MSRERSTLASMGADLRAAFTAYWSLLGLTISAISAANLLSTLVHLEMSAWAQHVLGVYRALTYPIISFLTAPLRLELTNVQRDVIAIWLSVGAAVGRTFWVIRRRTRRVSRAKIKDLLEDWVSDRGPFGSDEPVDVRAARKILGAEGRRRRYLHNGPLGPFVNSDWLAVLFLLVSVVAWPVAATILLWRPIVYRGEFHDYRAPPTTMAWHTSDMVRDYDIRVVLLIQISAVYGVAAGMIALATFGFR